jgi:hypothetical protein
VLLAILVYLARRRLRDKEEKTKGSGDFASSEPEP